MNKALLIQHSCGTRRGFVAISRHLPHGRELNQPRKDEFYDLSHHEPRYRGDRIGSPDVRYADNQLDPRNRYQDLDKTCEGIAKLSQKDAETYRHLAKRAITMLPMLGAGMYAPPMPMGAFFAMMDQSDEGREVLDAMQRYVWSVRTYSCPTSSALALACS